MFERTPCFMDPEPPPAKLADFFPPTVHISENIGGDPPEFLKARLPFGTPESAIACVVTGVRSLMYQRDILLERLKVAEGMRAFVSHRMGLIEELRVKLGQVERGSRSLEEVEKEKQAARVEAERLRKEIEGAERLREEKEVAEVKLQGSEQENARLRKEIEELRSGFEVDEMYFVGYRCCMKKNDITHDIPSFPSDDEDDLAGGSS
ncbi:hypothetical protein PVL29_017512 [Vitis rotundifolia]|uniref:Uncharacterized protein n=1 Tax=Vitis rotundifolia TaxID=103349 RepID=A0AA39DJ48_VITRO|nr:hypothetical protein PVL29_017512 [Vitis rotundifolia]